VAAAAEDAEAKKLTAMEKLAKVPHLAALSNDHFQ
jgi:hypothetical protein